MFLRLNPFNFEVQIKHLEYSPKPFFFVCVAMDFHRGLSLSGIQIGLDYVQNSSQ
jgi:hypothetical protein